MLLFWHVCGSYNTICILTKQSILKQSHGNTEAKFYLKKKFDVLRTHWMEIMKKNRDSWCPASWLTVFQVSEKKEVPRWRRHSIYFLKEKKVLCLEARVTQIAQTQMIIWSLYWNDNESNYIANCRLIEKLLWQFRHTGMSNKDNEHFYEQRPLKLFKCNIIEMPFWCDYSITKSEFLRHIR